MLFNVGISHDNNLTITKFIFIQSNLIVLNFQSKCSNHSLNFCISHCFMEITFESIEDFSSHGQNCLSSSISCFLRSSRSAIRVSPILLLALTISSLHYVVIVSLGLLFGVIYHLITLLAYTHQRQSIHNLYNYIFPSIMSKNFIESNFSNFFFVIFINSIFIFMIFFVSSTDVNNIFII